MAMMFKLQTLQSKQLLQAEEGEGQGEDDVLAIDLVSRDLRRLLRKGDLKAKRIACKGKAARASEGRSNKSGVWLSFQPSTNLDGTYEAIITTSRNRGK